MLKILWLAPNFNHYKARFLNHLATENDVSLTILSGTGRDQMGDHELEEDWNFKQIKLTHFQRFLLDFNTCGKKESTTFLIRFKVKKRA
jgi:hypothetical protein